MYFTLDLFYQRSLFVFGVVSVNQRLTYNLLGITITIMRYKTTDGQVEGFWCQSMVRYGILYAEAVWNMKVIKGDDSVSCSSLVTSNCLIY